MRPARRPGGIGPGRAQLAAANPKRASASARPSRGVHSSPRRAMPTARTTPSVSSTWTCATRSRLCGAACQGLRRFAQRLNPEGFIGLRTKQHLLCLCRLQPGVMRCTACRHCSGDDRVEQLAEQCSPPGSASRHVVGDVLGRCHVDLLAQVMRRRLDPEHLRDVQHLAYVRRDLTEQVQRRPGSSSTRMVHASYQSVATYHNSRVVKLVR